MKSVVKPRFGQLEDAWSAKECLVDQKIPGRTALVSEHVPVVFRGLVGEEASIIAKAGLD